MKETIYLFDGSAYIFRAFYATPRLTNSDGFPTNALYGFTRMCLKFLRDTAPGHAVMVFDAGQKTFRNELYEEYKANRDECPEDLKPQMSYFRDISRALGFPVVELPGYEADDVIGTLARALRSLDYSVVIVSADKDLMQLVSDQVSMWDTMRDKHYDRDAVREKLGVYPEQVIDYLAIAGDSSDNVPGLKGAGPKTAIQLIEGYGSVENILSSAAEIAEDKSIRSRKKIAEMLETGRELLELSKQLVTICTDAPLELIELAAESDGEHEDENFSHMNGVHNADHLLRSIEFHGLRTEELSELVEKFDFHSLFQDFEIQKHSRSKPTLEKDYQLILKADFDSWLTRFREQKEISLDLETTSLDVHEAKIVGIAVCWDETEAFYIPCGHHERVQEQLSSEYVLNAIRDVVESAEVKKIGQNLKYDTQVFLTHGVHLRGVWFDTMVAAYLLHPDTGGYGLSNLAKEYLGYTMLEYSEVVSDGADFRQVSLERALEYAAEDAHITWLLYRKLETLIAENGLEKVCYEVESPLVEVLSSIEHVGIGLNVAFLNEMNESVSAQLQALEQKIYEAADCEFNINSPKQLGEVLFEKLGIPTEGVKKTKTGYSTNQAVLEQIQDEHPVPALILEYRGLHKLKSTYLESLPKEVSPVTGRVHTRLNQTIAATGRLSSSEPNLQNIPIQTPLGRQVRRAFVPSEGSLFIAADYSQIELRLLAHLSGDEVLIQAFHEGYDIHERTAREVLGISEGVEVTPEDRRLGKTLNFGIVYGMSGFRLAKELGIPVAEGTAYIEAYFGRYPRVREYFQHVEEQMEKTGEVRTLLGRRRIVHEIEVGVRDKNFVKRAAMNAPLQGSAADLIKMAMIRMAQLIESEQLPLTMVLQVHDELLFELQMDGLGMLDVERFKNLIAREMEGVLPLQVPLVVGVASGSNWEEAHA
jgi:DNA polymerase-1